MSEKKRSIEDRLNAHPILKNRIESLIELVEDAGDDIEKANDAEQRVINELRQMGNELLHDWGKNKEPKKVEELLKSNDKISGHGKKKLNGTQHSEK